MNDVARPSRSGRFIKRQPLLPSRKQQWSLLLQTLFIAGLVEHSRWSEEEAVFHGGTSLKLGWGSPRWSENLDFLLKRDLLKAAEDNMKGALVHVRAQLARIDATLQVELKGKTTDRMARYEAVLTKPGILGRAAVRVEFWGVEGDYLRGYRSVPRMPQPPRELADAGYFVRVQSMLPVATLNSVLADKLVAAANRPYVKGRDIFDMWWIQQERDFERTSSSTIAKSVLFHATAYDTSNESQQGAEPGLVFQSGERLAHALSGKLRAWAQRICDPDYLPSVQSELKQFLVDSMGGTEAWDRHWKAEVATMIAAGARTAIECADALDIEAQDETTPADVQPGDALPRYDVPRG